MGMLAPGERILVALTYTYLIELCDLRQAYAEFSGCGPIGARQQESDQLLVPYLMRFLRRRERHNSDSGVRASR